MDSADAKNTVMSNCVTISDWHRMHRCGLVLTHPHVQISQMHFSSGTALIDGRLLAAAGDEVDVDLAAAPDVAIVSDEAAVFKAVEADEEVLLCTVVVEEDIDVLDVIDVFLTATSVLFVLIVRSPHCHSLQFSTWSCRNMKQWHRCSIVLDQTNAYCILHFKPGFHLAIVH